MYYLNACMLDAYGSKADELVVRRRLEDHKVGALLSPELLQTASPHPSGCWLMLENAS